MKTLKMIGLMAMLCFIMPAFVSCDKDDDKEATPRPGDVLGMWAGSLAAKVMNIDCEMPGIYEISIQKESEDKSKVKLVIPETSFKYPGSDRVSTIPSFTIAGVDVKESPDGYVISKDNYSEKANGVEYSGSIEGKITGVGAEISYTVKPGAMPMDISYTFKGYSYSSQITKLK